MRESTSKSFLLPIAACLVAGCLILGAPAAQAAEHVVEARPNNTFSPAELEIQAGDTVTWRNAGGSHNVAADDGSFRCAHGCDGQGGDGDPSSAAWEFSLTFDEPDTIPYNCEVHVGVGMRGTITVVQATPQESGNLRFATGSQTRNEGGGSFNVGVSRVNGSDGAVSVDYATSDGSASAGADYTAANGTLSWADGDDSMRSIQVSILDDDATEPDETINLALSNPGGGAGLGSPSNATLTIRDDDEAPQAGELSFVSSLFEVGETDLSKSIAVERTGGTAGAVSVDYATSDGSALDGADYTAASGTLFWSDGEGGTQSFDVAIVDDEEEENTETVNLSLSNATEGATLGTSSATLEISDDDAEGGCVDDDVTLCLGEGGRFKVTVTWETKERTGVGETVRFGNRDSGLFFFFGEDNIELLLKVLNACGINERFWFFAAATTDQGFVITVEDTEADVTRKYSNELGETAQTVTDTDAFATCP